MARRAARPPSARKTTTGLIWIKATAAGCAAMCLNLRQYTENGRKTHASLLAYIPLCPSVACSGSGRRVARFVGDGRPRAGTIGGGEPTRHDAYARLAAG